LKDHACPECGRVISQEDTSNFSCSQCGTSLSGLYDVTEIIAHTLELWGETLAHTPEAHQSLQVENSVAGTSSDPPTIRPFIVGDAKAASFDIPQDFQLLDLLGEGGMGLVYQARQNSLGRSIALKMIKPEHATSQQARDLFLAEAMVTSQLDHPNIVPIHELGTNDQDQLFYSMKEVKGSPWSSGLFARPLSDNLDILIRMADGVAFAHVHGVIHRDLKPSNVMLGDFGEILLMDWGLAVRFDPTTELAALTPRTALAGTPVYMAPEMARGEHKKIGPKSDLYLLGAILFQLLTGKPPHYGTNAHACIILAAQNMLNETEVKGELMDVARKAMATHLEDRYPDVRAFQEALRTYQSHSASILISERAEKELITARERQDYNHYARSVFGFQEALTSWDGNEDALRGLQEAIDSYARCALSRYDLDLAASLVEAEREQHPALHAGIQAAIKSRDQRQTRLKLLKRAASGMGIAIFTILAIAFFWIRMERDRSLAAEEDARRALMQAEHQNYFNLIALAGQKIDDHLFDQAVRLLADAPPLFRGWEWGHLQVLCHEDLRTFAPQLGPILAIAYAPDGTTYAHGSEDGRVCIRDAESDELLFNLTMHSSRINDLAFSPDGLALATVSNDKTMRLWNTQTGEPLAEMDGRDYLNAVAFHPNGKQLVTAGSDKIIRLWNVESGEPLHLLEGHTDWVLDVEFDPEGTHLLSSSRDGTARWWDLETRELIYTLPGPSGEMTSVAVAPHGRLGLTGSEDGSLQVWNFSDGSLLHSWPAHAGGVRAVAWPKGTPWMLSAGEDHELREWSAPGEMVQRAFVGHRDAVLAIACRPDGSRILSGGLAGQIKCWDSDQSSSTRILSGHEDHVNAISFSPDGRWIATGSWDGTAQIWNAATGENVQTLEGHDDLVRSVAFSPDSLHLLTASWDMTTRIFQVESGQMEHAFGGHEDFVHAAVYNHQGTHILTGSSDRTARYRQVDTGAEVFVLKGHTNWVTAVAISPDDRYAATGGRDARVLMWDLSTGEIVRGFEGHEAAISSVAFSPDGTLLLTAGQDHTARLWTAATSELVHELKGHGDQVHVAVFNPAGDRVLTGGNDETARVWDVKTGKEMIALRGYKGGIYSGAFHPDGRSIGVAGLDHVGLIWTAAPWTE
jgi:WD40 repeat protein/serine/threonine protein kinase